MTRIFDALKKAQAGRPPAPVHPPAVAPVPPPDPGLTPGPLRGPAAGWPGAPLSSPIGRAVGRAGPSGRSGPGAEVTPLILPIRAAVALPEDVVREMTKLRVSIEALLPDRAARSVMFLSAQGHEGTSTVAYQFAFILARDARIRTLFVDAHARRPSLRTDAPGESGSSGGAEGGFAADRASRRTRFAVPDRAFHGVAEDAPAGVLDAWPLGEQFHAIGVLSPWSVREVIEWGSGRYDWIVFDGPPVLESPDAASISAATDGVVVVVEAGRTKKPVLQRSVELLRKAGGRVMGSVLNRRRLEIPEFIYRRI